MCSDLKSQWHVLSLEMTKPLALMRIVGNTSAPTEPNALASGEKTMARGSHSAQLISAIRIKSRKPEVHRLVPQPRGNLRA